MLQTAAERQRALTGGAISLAAVTLFVGLAAVSLLFAGGGAAIAGILFDPYILRVLRFTLLQALLSTALSIVFAIPVARALARQPHFLGRIWIIRLMAVPMGPAGSDRRTGLDRDMGQAGVVELAYDEDRA